jgi:hypothetical protein
MTRSPSCARRVRSPRALHLAHSDYRMIVPRLRGRCGRAKPGLELVLGEPSAQLTTASRELLGAGLCGPMHGMVAPAVAPAGHRERIFPGRHEGLQLGRRTSQFCLQAFSDPSFHGAFSCIESAASDCTMSHETSAGPFDHPSLQAGCVERACLGTTREAAGRYLRRTGGSIRGSNVELIWADLTGIPSALEKRVKLSPTPGASALLRHSRRLIVAAAEPRTRVPGRSRRRLPQAGTGLEAGTRRRR